MFRSPSFPKGLRRGQRRRSQAAFECLDPRTLLAGAPLPTVSVADARLSEGNAGTRGMTFTLSLSASSSRPVMVRYATIDGTATVRTGDYAGLSGWLMVPPGRTQATVTVAVKGDKLVESDETFRLVLSRPSGCTLGRSSATGTIVNDDAPPQPTTPGSWTILVYMSGEDLNTYARQDINEMERALSTLPGSVRFVVSWDQPAVGDVPAYATTGGRQAAWRTYGRSVLKADTNPSMIASTFDLSFGERNTGDPATLVDFVKWGVATAPAAHYALQMWGHGGGLEGSQFDGESGGDPLTIAEMAAALGSPGMPTFDLVGYDNCLMGMAEIGAAIAPYVSGTFVASQDLVNGTGQDYATAYSALAVADPSQVTAAQVAAGMVSSYGTQYLDDPDMLDTFSATSAPGYASLTSALRTFVAASAELTEANRQDLLDGIDTSVSGYLTPWDTLSFGDLGGFMTLAANTTTLPLSVQTAAAGVGTALTSLVSAKTTDQRGSSGLSVYLPTDAADPYLATYATDAAAFCAATNWNTFANWLATGTGTTVVASTAGRAATRGHHAGDAGIPAFAFAAMAGQETGGIGSSPRRQFVAVRRGG